MAILLAKELLVTCMATWSLSRLCLRWQMADIWPIENVWSIVKNMVKAKEPKSKQELKITIKAVWKENDSDKQLCKSVISSIPDRRGAVISVVGKQIRRSDYS